MVSDPFVQLGNSRMALVLLAIAEENNLPIYGVLIPDEDMGLENGVLVPIDIKSPGRLIMRWDKNGKHNVLNQKDKVNKGDFIWHPSVPTFFNDEEEILYDPLLNKKVLEKNIYLKNLNKKELLGLAYYKKAAKRFSKPFGNFQYGKQIEYCNKAINLFPKLPSLYELKGDCFYYMKENKKAIKNYTKAIEINPKAIRYVKRGKAFMKLNENEKAQRDYEESKKLCSNKKLYKVTLSFWKYKKTNDYFSAVVVLLLHILAIYDRNELRTFSSSNHQTDHLNQLYYYFPKILFQIHHFQIDIAVVVPRQIR